MEIKFKALVKEVKVKSLVSLDKGLEIKLHTDKTALDLVNAPADDTVNVTIQWGNDAN